MNCFSTFSCFRVNSRHYSSFRHSPSYLLGYLFLLLFIVIFMAPTTISVVAAAATVAVTLPIDNNVSSSILEEDDQTSHHHHHHYLHVDYDNIIAISKTTATLQVVSNPILNKRYSPIASKLYNNLHLLNADLVRYAAWFPYPKIGVAELEPPNYVNKTTSWKFGQELQQMFLDTWNSVVKHDNSNKRLVITFSTQPAWMFNTTDWSYENKTNKADWKYGRNGNWKSETTQLVADYYGRFASWIINGEFQDEFNNTITGGPKLGLGNGGVTHWEVFNEPEGEHNLSIQQYNIMYDSIVQNIRKRVDDTNHTIQFIGLSLEGHNEWNYWNGFLNLSNHHPDVYDSITNGYVSFHFYAKPSSRTNVTTYVGVFGKQLDTFFNEIDAIIQIRDTLSPSTKLALNEAGVIPPNDNDIHAEELPPIYFNMAAAFYTVLYSELSIKGIDIVGSSQYCGCPSIPKWNIPDRQYPGVSMTNWTTGDGNPRYWALKLLLDSLDNGDTTAITSDDDDKNNNTDRIVYSTIVGEGKQEGGNQDVYIQGRISKQGNRIMILVNKSYLQQTVILPPPPPPIPNPPVSSSMSDGNNDSDGGYYYHVSVVDETTHDGPWKEFNLTTATRMLTLKPFAVAVVRILLVERDDIQAAEEEEDVTTTYIMMAAVTTKRQ